MENTVIIIATALGLATIVSGGVIALIAFWRAPDGFEDTEGCHLGSTLQAGNGGHSGRNGEGSMGG